MQPIDFLTCSDAKAVKFVLFDIDDTITHNGKLLNDSYTALWSLHDLGIKAIPVTGRPAGWCDMIARQWPVSGVVGENGAFAFYMNNNKLEALFHPDAPDVKSTRYKLDELANKALAQFKGLRLAKDQAYRLFDIALDFAEEEPNLGLDFAAKVKDFCVKEGAIAKVSSIHVNAWFGNYDKLSMSKIMLEKLFNWNESFDLNAVMYFGDSPNDEPMFKYFPLSCGVANINNYTNLLQHKPQFVTDKPFGEGFAEGVKKFLDKRIA